LAADLLCLLINFGYTVSSLCAFQYFSSHIPLGKVGTALTSGLLTFSLISSLACILCVEKLKYKQEMLRNAFKGSGISHINDKDKGKE
jgi:hypothetical protein